ncbi:MAG: 4Fe-4S binding protein [Firmicutes bacterium]|nr:4Fe-4S binding protein [Bacillota bacterium]
MLPKTMLGNTEINVTKLGFGALVIGPMQKGMSPEEGAKVIRRAFEQGITFVDTAHVYGTYEHIRKAKEGWRHKTVIATKTPASDYETAEEHIIHALHALDLKKLDIMLLHAARANENVFHERAGAYQCLKDYKKKGLIEAIGISTHNVGIVNVASGLEDIDIIHPLINMTGLGILGGTVSDMAVAINKASRRGKGIYGMKALAGGNLLDEMDKAFKFVRGLPGMDAVVVGMVSEAEVDMNCRIFKGETISENERKLVAKGKRLKIVKSLCTGCGNCIDACPNQALSLIEGKSSVDRNKCILCGYCTPYCPEFAIRVI